MTCFTTRSETSPRNPSRGFRIFRSHPAWLTDPARFGQDAGMRALLTLFLLFASVPVVPAQDPPEQTSPEVQDEPSSQLAVLFELEQPVSGEQMSSVHTSVSLHNPLSGVPPQVPPLHTSPVVQDTPSSQASVLLL